MRRVVLGVALSFSTMLSAAVFAAPTVVDNPSAPVGARVIAPAPTLQSRLDALNARWSPLVKPEHRPKTVQIGRALYERVRTTPEPKWSGSSMEGLARQLASELDNLGLSVESEVLAVIVLAITEGGRHAVATAQLLAGQIAGFRAVKACNGDAACIDGIKPTPEMSTSDLALVKKRLATEKRSIDELIARETATLKLANRTKARFEVAVIKLTTESSPDAGAPR